MSNDSQRASLTDYQAVLDAHMEVLCADMSSEERAAFDATQSALREARDRFDVDRAALTEAIDKRRKPFEDAWRRIFEAARGSTP